MTEIDEAVTRAKEDDPMGRVYVSSDLFEGFRKPFKSGDAWCVKARGHVYQLDTPIFTVGGWAFDLC